MDVSAFSKGVTGLDSAQRTLTVFQPAPTGDRGHATGEVVVVVRHTDGHDVLVVGDGRLELQQRDVVLERGRVVLPVNDHALHVLADAPLGLHLTADVVLAEHGHQVGQKPARGVISRGQRVRSSFGSFGGLVAREEKTIKSITKNTPCLREPR